MEVVTIEAMVEMYLVQEVVHPVEILVVVQVEAQMVVPAGTQEIQDDLVAEAAVMVGIQM